MPTPFLDRRSPFRVSYALLVLIVFFFLMPFAFQSARLSLLKKENDVKDWLPSDFPETKELTWFADHFAGESFVLATWPGCNVDDQRLLLLEQKIRHESLQYDWKQDKVDHPEWSDDMLKSRQLARQLGHELQLLYPGDSLYNWGGRKEKWLMSADGAWYFITPDGHLYRWEGSMNGPAAAIRAIRRSTGSFVLDGQFITAFGKPTDEQQTNPFYNDPTLITAPLFATVQTGDSIVNQLAAENGPLWPVDLTAPEYRPVIARRRAMQRLTGTLFAPAAPPNFPWTAEAFARLIPDADRARLQSRIEPIVTATLDEFAASRLGGDVGKLATATVEDQADAWYAVFDALEVAPPPRLTAVVITLTELAKNNLAFALGRGALGAPRGRLLQLAAECGIQPPAPPSMAPPPFNRAEIESIAGAPPLRMGGPPVDNIAIDEEGTVTLVRLVGYSVLVGVLLSYLCFRSVKITVMVFIVGGSAAMLSMACVGWTGGRVDAILMSMPSLVYVLGLSGAIHVVNYYRDEVRSGGPVGAAGRALRHAMLPCFLASFTTAIGLASLYTSNLAPISNFGIYSAVGVLATLAILFSYLPAAISVFTPSVISDAERTSTAADPQDESNSQFSQWWAGVGRFITHHHAVVSITCTVVMLVVAYGVFSIQTSVQLLKLFDSDSRIIRDYAWVEDNFGKLVPMELVVRMPQSMQQESGRSLTTKHGTQQPVIITANSAAGPIKPAPVIPPDVPGDRTDSADVIPTEAQRVDRRRFETTSLTLLERIEAISRIRTVVHQTLGEPGLDVVGQAMSADTFLPPLPGPSKGNSLLDRNRLVRRTFETELEKSYNDLRGSDYLRLERSGPFAESELWRISLRVGALSDVDYGQFIYSLRRSVEPVARAYDVRSELIGRLADAGFYDGRNPKPAKVLIVGTGKPESLQASELILPQTATDEDQSIRRQQQDQRIQTKAIFAATLGELLENENVAVRWYDSSDTRDPLRVGDDKWNQIITQVDAVIDLGDPNVPASSLASASLLVDGQSIRDRQSVPVLKDGYPDVEGAGEMQIVYTGVVPVVYKAQRTLLASLGESIGLAFVMIAGVMMVLLNPGGSFMSGLRLGNLNDGFWAGWVSMIPNMFPILLVFGAMGHLNHWLPGQFLVDIGTMMTASVAMGVAVDDTIHFLAWFRSYLNQGIDRTEAIIETYRRVGPAMTQTTVVGGLGLFVFALSTFTPTQRFGTLMLVLLGTALIGDLIFLPALLAGPLGRFFKPRPGKTSHQPDRPVQTTADLTGEAASSQDAPEPVDDPPLPDTDQRDTQDSPKTRRVYEPDTLPLLRIHKPPVKKDRSSANPDR